MEYRIFTAFFIITYLFVTLIQEAVAPGQEKPADVKKMEMLMEKKNAQKVYEVFFAALQGKGNAQINSYEQRSISPELRAILESIAQNPRKVGKEVITPIIKGADKKAVSNSLAYRMVVKPLWHVVKGVGFIAGKLFGTAVMSAGDMLKVVANAAKEGAVAGNDGKPPDAATEQTLKEVNNVAQKVIDFGENVSKGSQRKLEKVQGKPKDNSANADAAAAQQGIQPASSHGSVSSVPQSPSVRRQDTPPVSRQNTPPISRQNTPPIPRQDSLSDHDEDPPRTETASSHQRDGSTPED